jgi:cullin 3
MLRDALSDIHRQNSSKLLFEELYRASYKIVLRKKGGLLYDRVKEFEEEWFAKNVIPEIEGLVSQNLLSVTLGDAPGSTVNLRRQMGEQFLQGLRTAWDGHERSMNMMADVLMYLDRSYCADSNRPSIFTSTIGLFRDHILRSSLNRSDFMVFDILNSVILDQINMERSGDVIDRNLIRNCTGMLYSLYENDQENESDKLYLTVFEPEFLKASHAFYKAECERLLSAANASHWLRRTKERLAEEDDRCNATIRPDTREKIIGVVEMQLISAHLKEFLALEGSGLKWMVDNDKTEELAILYDLVARVDEKKDNLRAILQSRVVELGLEIEQVLKNTDFSLPAAGQGEGEDGEGGEGDKSKSQTRTAAAQQTAAAIKWVDDVLLLKDKFDNLWRSCFREDLLVQTSLTKSFSDFINMFGRSSEYVSLFIDDSLKRGIRGKTEAEIDVVLEKAITIIRFLQDKDMFERYYQKHLARRLLHGKSESHDVEKQMISRMKQELGNQFTSKFEGMFRDMVTSAELTSNYRDHIRNLGDVDRKPIELAVNILTTNNWPPEVMGRSSQLDDGSRLGCVYPHEIKKLQESLTKFYLTNRTGRKLTWVASAGTVEIKCMFPAIKGKTTGPLSKERRYEITVPTFGMLVMLLFNDLDEDGSLSFEEIQAKTNIPNQDLVKTLTSLSVAPKARVLTKEPMNKSVKAGDIFKFNMSFASKTIKIKAPIITSISRVEDNDERKETEEKNNQTRAHIVDAAIVRIMKYVACCLEHSLRYVRRANI